MFDFKCKGTLEDFYILVRLGNCLGLSPITNAITPKTQRFYKYYALVLLLGILIGASVSFSGRIESVYTLLPITISLVDGLSLIILTLTNLFCIYNLSVNGNGSSLSVKFFEGMTSIDVKLNKYCRKMNKKTYYLELIIGHLFIITFSIFDSYIWMKYVGIDRFKNYVCRTIQNYINFVTMFIIRYFVLSLEIRFQGLGVYIKEHSKKILSCNQICLNEEFSSGKRPIAEIYNALCEQINVFNKLYGLPTLLLSLYFISELLMSLMLSIVYVFQRNKKMGDVHFGMDLFWLCFFWIIKDVVSYLKIISPCHATIEEAKKIPVVCYEFLHEISERTGFKEKNLRSELTLVALQSSTLIPSFSAAGFFNIDFSTFFTLMGFVTSYLVVLIQFN